MQNIIDIMHEGNYSCVIMNGEIRTFSQRGVADIYHLLKYDPAFLEGAYVADKIIGKAAAALLVLGKVKCLYADIISAPALDLLGRNGITPAFGKEVPNIINRNNNGLCPLETVCIAENSADRILPLIENFFKTRADKQ